ncbi:hypothetical protein PTQ19_12055 [Microbacterium esteraromaticum]|uniref:hypothetical protein n=1 Tax=Microbacterium esteraromaticum TaxID=57043 RepID=UPI002367DA97|nr:hypothetical protein [Microbacterium esteraromaticum]WDH78244.1 hypothetical protein PTQ19_12055 [Microbacterium esteraromaticum]
MTTTQTPTDDMTVSVDEAAEMLEELQQELRDGTLTQSEIAELTRIWPGWEGEDPEELKTAGWLETQGVGYAFNDGHIGAWLAQQQRDARSGKISAERHDALDAALPGWLEAK